MNKLKQELLHFSGTENYYRDFMEILVTDGIKYFQETAEANWVVSDIAVIVKMKLKNENFISIDLIVKDGKATIQYTDGNDTKLYKQDYEYADLEDIELKFFFVDNVLMLSNEY